MSSMKMTAQKGLKKFLRLFGNSQSHSNHGSHNSDFVYLPSSPLQRSKTECLSISYASTPRQTEAEDSSEEYSGNPSDLSSSLPTSNSLSVLESGNASHLHPLVSYKEALTLCDADCTCDCHSRPGADQSQLTLCRCHMSGYESYRRAVYGGRNRSTTPIRDKQTSSERRKKNRKSLDSRKLFGSAETLSSDGTVKGASSSNPSSNRSTDTSESGSKSHRGSSHRNSAKLVRDKNRATITDDINTELHDSTETSNHRSNHSSAHKTKVGSRPIIYLLTGSDYHLLLVCMGNQVLL